MTPELLEAFSLILARIEEKVDALIQAQEDAS